MDTLTKYGMSEVGRWQFGDYKSTKHLAHQRGLSFTLERGAGSLRNVVYAFALDSKVAYIGETSDKLAVRLACYRYGNPKPTDTDNRVKTAIAKHLEIGGQVSIWVCEPQAILKAGSMTIALSASKPLEEHLIAELRPILNRKNTGRER